MTVWSPFPADTEYFGQSGQQWMLNYRVDDLDALLEQLQREGVEVLPRRDNADFGKFGWIVDPEGNRVELWEAPKKKLSENS